MATHGDCKLPAATIDDYSSDLRDQSGELVGDRATMRAFLEMLEDQRAQDGQDDLPRDEHPSKEELDRVVENGEPGADAVLHTVDRFAHTLLGVVEALLLLPAWEGTERIAVGGGMRGSRVGELCIGRTEALLRSAGRRLELVPIWNHPDEAGLLGAVHLPPPDQLRGHDGLLAVDIGGTNIRAGCVVFDPADLSDPTVAFSDKWKHGDEEPTREQAVNGLLDMLKHAAERAEREGHRLAPVIGIGCPGKICADGTIASGGQNLPGNWEAPFNLPAQLAEALPPICGARAEPLLHNDAVVQGLSEVPRMGDVRRWGVLTIGTGLGNARFSRSTTA